MQTTTTINGTTYLHFIGENRLGVLIEFSSFVFFLFSNGSCVSSEKAQIVSNVKSDRVSVQWANGEGKMIEKFVMMMIEKFL